MTAGRISRSLLAALLVASVLPATGCDRIAAAISALRGGSQTATTAVETSSTATATAEATGSPEHGPAETIEVSHGRIYTPPKGSSVRTRLMNAARDEFSTSSLFLVYQLYVQGDVAIGDIAPEKGGGRKAVAWLGPDWKIVWSAPYGGSRANASSLKNSVPQASDGLVARLDFDFSPGPSQAQLRVGAVAAAKRWYQGLINQSAAHGVKAVATGSSLYRDGDGVWWASVGLRSQPEMLEGTLAIMRYSGGTWHLFAAEGSDGYSRSVPESVLRGLGAPVF